MLHRFFAIADTCFLIDWARYRRRDILYQLFQTVFIPEQVLDEVVSENTIAWIAKGLASGKLSLYTTLSGEVDEARMLIEWSRLHPQALGVDLPEALCLVVGMRRGYIVLTENRGALLIPRINEEYRDVVVWRALEIILEAIRRNIIEPDCTNPRRLFDEYSQDTLHIFPRESLNKALTEVEEICRAGR